MPERSQSRGRRPFIIAAVLIAAVVVAAWVLQAGATDAGESPEGDSPASYSIKVERGGEVLKQYGLAALQALPRTSVVIDGKEQDGPLLSTVLADAGAASYDHVVIYGAGIRDEGSLELTAARVAANVQFDFAERGTAKICGPKLDRSEWVRDVLTISVD